jgi:hypothetical protein
VLFQACSTGQAGQLGRDSAEGAPALPGLAALDAVRVASAQWPVQVNAPLMEQHTLAVGDNLGFAPEGAELAYAVYRISPPVESVVSVVAGGEDGFYLLVADYAAGSWAAATELSGGFAAVSLDTLGDPISPAGHVYCAVVAPAGVQGQLTSLALDYDGPASIRYVATPADGGDDLNPGTAEAPWATLNYAGSEVEPDTLVIVRPGTYEPVFLGQSGEPDAPIVWHAEPGAVIDASTKGYGVQLAAISWNVIDGFTIVNSLGYGITSIAFSPKAQHNTIRNNLIQNCAAGAIRINGSDYVVVEGNVCEGTSSGDALQLADDSDFAVVRNNTVRNNNYSGIAFSSGLGVGFSLDQAEISGNVIVNNNVAGLSAGLVLDAVKDSLIVNNLVEDPATGIWFTNLNEEPSTGNTLANNTVVQAASAASCVLISPTCTGNALYNNILFCANPAHGAVRISSAALTGFASDNNIVSDNLVLDGTVVTLAEWQAATLRDAESQVSLPALTFVNPALPGYHLLSTASAVGSAQAAFAPAIDLDGVARPQGGSDDCGCYEYVP